MSDSAKFRITSRKEGTDPVVMALIFGMVIVGGLALAVNGNASPDRIKLFSQIQARRQLLGPVDVPLKELKARVSRVNEVARTFSKSGTTTCNNFMYLRRASTTIKMTLSKGAEGGST